MHIQRALREGVSQYGNGNQVCLFEEGVSVMGCVEVELRDQLSRRSFEPRKTRGREQVRSFLQSLEGLPFVAVPERLKTLSSSPKVWQRDVREVVVECCPCCVCLADLVAEKFGTRFSGHRYSRLVRNATCCSLPNRFGYFMGGKQKEEKR